MCSYTEAITEEEVGAVVGEAEEGGQRRGPSLAARDERRKTD